MIRCKHTLAVIFFLAGVAPALPQAADLGALREKALEMTNASRRDHDLPPLDQSEELDAAAQRHADDMLRRRYYAHESPEGNTVRDRFLEEGGDGGMLVAENIARCTGCTSPDGAAVERLHRSWMNSPEHRDNILHEGLDQFGFGIAGGGDQPQLAVQTFAGPGTARGEAEELAQDEVAATLRDAVNRLRRAADREPLDVSKALTMAARDLEPETLEGLSLDGLSDPLSVLSSEERSRWRALATLAASCSGCGPRPSQGDPEAFVQDWEGGEARDTLLDRSFTRVGAVLKADGTGRKLMLVVLGQPR